MNEAVSKAVGALEGLVSGQQRLDRHGLRADPEGPIASAAHTFARFHPYVNSCTALHVSDGAPMVMTTTSQGGITPPPRADAREITVKKVIVCTPVTAVFPSKAPDQTLRRRAGA